MHQVSRLAPLSLLLVGLVAFAPSQTVPTGVDVQARPKADSDVRDFGAIGDGKADDTAALQKAVDSGIGCVRLPKGVYRITKPILIELDRVGYTSFTADGVARIEGAGPGPGLKFIGTHFKSADPNGFTPEVWGRQHMPCVDGVGITGDHLEAVGIQAVGTMQLTVSRTHSTTSKP